MEINSWTNQSLDGDIVAWKYRRGNSSSPISTKQYSLAKLMELVDCGDMRLKAQYGLDNGLKIQIEESSDSMYYYFCRIDVGGDYRKFNEKYGKYFIDNWNLYL